MKKTSILLVLSTMGLLLASCGEEQSSVAPSSEESARAPEGRTSRKQAPPNWVLYLQEWIPERTGYAGTARREDCSENDATR